jgi:protein tyrosine/serine phosphatase
MKNLIFFTLIFVSGLATAAPEIPAFSQVSATVYRGGRPLDDGMVYLSQVVGIKTDINLQGGDIASSDPVTAAIVAWWEPGETAENIANEKHMAEDVLKMNFVSAPLNSMAEVSADEDVEIDRVLAVMADPTMQPVFVHCEHGVDRTGLIVALYRVKYEGVEIEKAHDEWVAHGHSGLAAYFTGNLDTYFYQKAATLHVGKNGA